MSQLQLQAFYCGYMDKKAADPANQQVLATKLQEEQTKPKAGMWGQLPSVVGQKIKDITLGKQTTPSLNQQIAPVKNTQKDLMSSL